MLWGPQLSINMEASRWRTDFNFWRNCSFHTSCTLLRHILWFSRLSGWILWSRTERADSNWWHSELPSPVITLRPVTWAEHWPNFTRQREKMSVKKKKCVSNSAVQLTNHEIRSVLTLWSNTQEGDVDIIEREREREREREMKPGVFVQIHANSWMNEKAAAAAAAAAQEWQQRRGPF